MRLPTFRRAADPTDTASVTESVTESAGEAATESVEETSDEPVQTTTVDEETETVSSSRKRSSVAVSSSRKRSSVDAVEPDHDAKPNGVRRRIPWSRVVAYGILPVLAFTLASGAGYLKWRDTTAREAQAARVESVQAAIDGTVALLSYRADTVEKDLNAAKTRMTGTFLDAYTKLTADVVIPGAKQKQISAVATVPAAASATAMPTHAVVLLFVNQSVIVGQSAPTSTASSVRVTLDKVGGRWLISQFDPV
jgi:Mce-associated membrane protein